MPRLPSTSWAPRPTSASRTRVFTVRDSGSQDPPARDQGAAQQGRNEGARSGAEVSSPDSDWRRRAAGRRGSGPPGAPPSPPQAYVYQADRLMQGDVPHSGTASIYGSRTSFRMVAQDTMPPAETSAAHTSIAMRKPLVKAAGWA